MKRIVFILLTSCLTALYASPIDMHRNEPEDHKGLTKHFLPLRPNVSFQLSVDQGDTSISIEYDGEVSELRAYIINSDDEVVYEDATSFSSLVLPLPTSGDYTIEVWVDDSLYYGEFSVE